MRANELINLDIDDLRYAEKSIWIRFAKGCKGSGHRHRLAPFTKLAQATLPIYQMRTRPLLGKSNTTAQALFLSENGNRITYDAMRLALLEIAESARKAGIYLPNPFGWHDLRRSFATEYLENRPEEVVKLSRYLGHTGLGTLHRYIRPSRKASQRATDSVLARFLPG
jgi:site-specific recombinase XerD